LQLPLAYLLCKDNDQLAVMFCRTVYRKLDLILVSTDVVEMPVAMRMASDWSCWKGMAGVKGASSTYPNDRAFLQTITKDADGERVHRGAYISKHADNAIFERMLECDVVENAMENPVGEYIVWTTRESFGSFRFPARTLKGHRLGRVECWFCQRRAIF